MSEIVLTAEEAQCLAEGGYTTRTVDDRVWRIAHEAYVSPKPWHVAADRHVSLSPAEVHIVTSLSEGLYVGGTLIRSEVAR